MPALVDRQKSSGRFFDFFPHPRWRWWQWQWLWWRQRWWWWRQQWWWQRPWRRRRPSCWPHYHCCHCLILSNILMDYATFWFPSHPRGIFIFQSVIISLSLSHQSKWKSVSEKWSPVFQEKLPSVNMWICSSLLIGCWFFLHLFLTLKAVVPLFLLAACIWAKKFMVKRETPKKYGKKFSITKVSLIFHFKVSPENGIQGEGRHEIYSYGFIFSRTSCNKQYQGYQTHVNIKTKFAKTWITLPFFGA